MKRTVITIIIIAALAAGGYLFYQSRNAQADTQSLYQTVSLSMAI